MAAAEPRVFPYGTCPACRKRVALREDGRVRLHKDTRPDQPKRTCWGSHRAPLEGK